MPRAKREPISDSLINPTVVLIGLDSTLTVRLRDYFLQRGWRILTATTSVAGRRLAHNLKARLVVVSPQLPDETGWLATAKMCYPGSEMTVVVVVDEGDHRARQMAHFLGARILFEQDDRLAALAGLFPRPQPVGVS